MAESMRIERVFNNNVVLCRDPAGHQMVLIGRGLGYGHRPGEGVDPAGAQRFVADEAVRTDHIVGVLSQSSDAEAEAAAAIVLLAQRELAIAPTQAVLLPVLDHLVAAIRRARQGIVIDFPLVFEVSQLYPEESRVGRLAVQTVRELLGVSLQDDEWVAFALHFINQQWARQDLGRTVAMTEALNAVFEHLEQAWGRPIDRAGSTSARFVTHLRYLFARINTSGGQASLGRSLLPAIRASHPEAADQAQQLARLLAGVVGRPLGPDEIAYLALHVARLEQAGDSVG